jgi:predicted nucleotidyltransferase component of viral defense system
MIIDDLKLTYDKNTGKPPLYIRNLLKEQLQFYLLNYVYNSIYAEKFLLKGGTCLRLCFDLPRLSEDLDFDVLEFETFSYDQFIKNLKEYFKSKLKYQDLIITVSGENKIIYLKFPILRKIGMQLNEQKPTEDQLFVRIDLAPVKGNFYKKELSLKSTYDFSFLIRRYGIEDLFAGKINAILAREKFEGKEKMARFKGRDFFDIWWLKEKNVRWNVKYLTSILKINSEKEVISKLNDKIQEAAIRKQELKADLLPFFENPGFVEDFASNLDNLRF